MKFKLGKIVAAALLASATLMFSQDASKDVDKAGKDTGDATKTAAKATAHATKTAGKDTGKATGKAAKATAHGVKKAVVGDNAKKADQKADQPAK